MSTNKERIEAVTAELATATTTINNLPDYPDLENVYGNSETELVGTNVILPTTNVIYPTNIQVLEDYIVYSWLDSSGYNDQFYIYRYSRQSGNTELILNYSWYYTMMDHYFLHYSNNKVCTFNNRYNHL